MAITVVATTNNTYASRSDTFVTKPAGTANGDFIFVAFLCGLADPGPPDPSQSSGFTVMPGFPTTVNHGGFNVDMWAYYKFANDEPTEWLFSHSMCAAQFAAVTYRGVDGTTPLDATPTTDFSPSGGAGALTTSAPSITTVTDGAMIVVFGHDWGSTTNNLNPPTGTTPTFTERVEVNPLIYIVDGILDTAGATGVKTWTNHNGGGDPWAAATVALRPGDPPTDVVHLPTPATGFVPFGPGRLSVYDGTTWETIRAAGRTFYVETGGDDGNPGSEAEPWATIGHGAAQLTAGDTLIVGGGTYYETDIVVAADGRLGRPITIRAAEGETVVVDGALAAYRTSGNTAWEVYDATRHIYRTTATLPSPGEFGYTGRIDDGGTIYMLTAYRDNDGGTGLAFLSADADLFDVANPYYMGPGQVHDADGHIYIRLDPNSDEAQWVGTSATAEAPVVISDLDPRNHAIHLAPNNNGIVANGNHLIVDGINLRTHWATFAGNGADVTFRNLEIWPTRFGALVDGPRWTFDNVNIEYHRPNWIARSDVKSFPEPAKDSRTGGISWNGTTGSRFVNGEIHGAFDAMLALGAETDLKVLNSWIDNSMDDGCQTGVNTYDFEWGYNLVTGAGPSHDRSGGLLADTPDTVYVHHNVFDNRTRVFSSRKPVPGDPPAENANNGYEPPPIFSGHGLPDYRDPWKIYNNTFEAFVAPGQQGVNHYLGPYGNVGGQGVHEAYNNIINIHSIESYTYRGTDALTGFESYDYNIYQRAAPTGPFAIEVRNLADELGDITTFAEWVTEMGFDTHSVSGTTMVPLDGSYQPAIGGPADGTGVDLSAKGWPGTTPGTDYIGAKAPV